MGWLGMSPALSPRPHRAAGLEENQAQVIIKYLPCLCFTRQMGLGGWVWCCQEWAIRPRSLASPVLSPSGSPKRPPPPQRPVVTQCPRPCFSILVR